MERSDTEGFNSSQSGAQANFGAANGGQPSTSGQPEQSSAPGDSSGVAGRAKVVASAVKEKASALPGIIADGLEAGAQALRQNRPATTAATSPAGSSLTASGDSGVAAVTDTLASGMQSSADWIRDADFDKLKQGVEQQVKEHPARSLLVALGAGYLIGKALRR